MHFNMDGYKILFIFLVAILSVIYGKREQNPCDEGMIPCDDGQCIESSFWCDSFSDCEDESDEKYCQTGSPNDCTEKHFVCDNQMCIPIVLRCSGWSECSDGSDEKNCDLDEPSNSFTNEYDGVLANTTTTTTTETYVHRTTEGYVYPSASAPHPPVLHNQDYPSGNSHWNNNQGNNRGNREASSTTIPPRRRPQRPTTTRGDPSRYPYERPMIYPPRSIAFAPRISSFNFGRRTIRSPNFSPFYFSKNYTKDLNYRYAPSIEYAKNWILSQKDRSYTWGRDTPRALIALSLISNSFKSDVGDNDLMRKSLQTHLGIKMLRNNTGIEKMSTTRLAMYINAVLATCQDPSDFWDNDLVEILYQTHHRLERYQRFMNPLIYLTLCLTNKQIDMRYLESFLLNTFPTEISKDIHILALTAMACEAHRNPRDAYIREKLEDAAQNLLTLMNPADGSFGSKYSTALAAQALMAINSTLSLRWSAEKTLDYLTSQQLADGSFGDMQATYYAIIALSGRSLVHLRNTKCDPVDVKKEWSPYDILNAEGPRKNIQYTLRVNNPESFSASMQLSVPINTNFFDIMRVAAHLDSRFKFNYDISKSQTYSVHTIANVPNDPERGMFWNLYWLRPSDTSIDFRERYLENIIELIPNDGDELLFWYLRDF